MKLYFAPGACSLSPHIALHEAGLKFDIEQVDLRAKQTKGGGDFRAINAKGQVPTLELDDGQILTEGAAIVQYIADKAPAARLAPAAGSMERYRLQEWLNYVASEIHKGFSPLFNPKLGDDAKQVLKDVLTAKFDVLSKKLEGRQYVMGDAFSVADAYLFTVLRWAPAMKIDMGKWPVLAAYMERVRARPGVQAAMVAEGLAK